MALVRVTQPAVVVTLAEAKAHLRVEHADDDSYITALVATATAWIDGGDGWLGRALGSQQWDMKADAYSGGMPECFLWSTRAGLWYLPLPLPPLISVDSVTYTDTAGALQTWAPASYVVSGVGAAFGGTITPASGVSWPSVKAGLEVFTVRFTAGYAGGIPAPIKHAILLLVGALYEGRGDREALLQSPAVNALLAPYRVFA